MSWIGLNKRWTKIYYTMSNQKKARVVTITSEKANFRIRESIRHNEEH